MKTIRPHLDAAALTPNERFTILITLALLLVCRSNSAIIIASQLVARWLGFEALRIATVVSATYLNDDASTERVVTKSRIKQGSEDFAFDTPSSIQAIFVYSCPRSSRILLCPEPSGSDRRESTNVVTDR